LDFYRFGSSAAVKKPEELVMIELELNELDIGSFCFNNHIQTKKSYKTFIGSVTHKGNMMRLSNHIMSKPSPPFCLFTGSSYGMGNTGHYRACVKDDDGNFSTINDNRVNYFPKGKLFEPEKSGLVSNDNRLTPEDIMDPTCYLSTNCYMLFYE